MWLLILCYGDIQPQLDVALDMTGYHPHKRQRSEGTITYDEGPSKRPSSRASNQTTPSRTPQASS